jgi:LysM domain
MSKRDHLGSRRREIFVRGLATVLAVALAFAVLAPPFARAEAESEGEGSSQPGAPIPGLEEGASFEPGGEETSLEEVPAAGGEEETEAGPSSEAEPPPAPEVSVPAPSVATEPTQVRAEPTPPVAEAPPAATTGPVYGTEEATPSYETAPTAPPEEPVRNEAIVAPRPSGKTPTLDRRVPKTTSSREEAPAPAPTEAPEPEPVSAAPVPPSSAVDRAGTLKGHPFHTVVSGECLWSIAEGVLPTGATDAKIAVEVARLWQLNATRIGTGDPNLILAGTVLRLR